MHRIFRGSNDFLKVFPKNRFSENFTVGSSFKLNYEDTREVGKEKKETEAISCCYRPRQRDSIVLFMKSRAASTGLRFIDVYTVLFFINDMRDFNFKKGEGKRVIGGRQKRVGRDL